MPEPAEPGVTRSHGEWALLVLEALLAVGAYGGAVGLVTGGIDLGETTADLPFQSVTFAAIALFIVNGLLPTVVFVGAVRRQRWAELGHLVVGLALVGWIVVQVSLLGWPPHWLQTLYFVWGCTITALGILNRDGRHR